MDRFFNRGERGYGLGYDQVGIEGKSDVLNSTTYAGARGRLNVWEMSG